MKIRKFKKITICFLLFICLSGNIAAQTTTDFKNPGDVRMYHQNPVWVGDEFIIEVYLNSGSQRLAAYGIDLPYDNSLLRLVSVEAGPDGFISAIPGHLERIITMGFDATGTGPREDLYILKIHFIARSPGTTPLQLVINKLSSPDNEIIGIPHAIHSSILILPAHEPGNAWLEHPDKVNYGMGLTAELHFDSGEQKLSSYRMSIQYDSLMLNVDTAKGSNGMEPGPDGFIDVTSSSEG